jgi:hypothetical protein
MLNGDENMNFIAVIYENTNTPVKNVLLTSSLQGVNEFKTPSDQEHRFLVSLEKIQPDSLVLTAFSVVVQPVTGTEPVKVELYTLHTNGTIMNTYVSSFVISDDKNDLLLMQLGFPFVYI